MAVGDQLDVQVWSKVERMPNWSARVEVSAAGTFTLPMPVLGDIKAAGFRMSTLKERLEGKELLGKYLQEPHVIITALKVAPNIRLRVSGALTLEKEIPRGTLLGQILPEFDSAIQQVPPNVKIVVKSVEGENFPADPKLPLVWGDEIVIPPAKPAPSAKATAAPPPERTLVTKQEYEDLQNFLKDYPAAQQLLQPFLTMDADQGAIRQQKIPWEQLHKDVRAKLESLVQKAVPAGPPEDFELVGLSVNLAAAGLLEAFLAFPDPQAAGAFVIKSFRKGDVVKPGETKDSDWRLEDIQPAANQIIVKKGKEPPVPKSLPEQKLIDLAFSGIIETKGAREAILTNPNESTPNAPLQRKRYKERDRLDNDILLTKITDKWVLLQKDNELQLVLLRDPQKRPTPAPSQPAPTNPAAPNAATAPEKDARAAAGRLTPDAFKKLMQALNTFNKMFLATPLF